jgi:hypothetical protein
MEPRFDDRANMTFCARQHPAPPYAPRATREGAIRCKVKCECVWSHRWQD